MHDIVKQKVIEALRLTNGHQGHAQKKLIEWAIEDERLLLALTKAHLPGIAAFAIHKIGKNDDWVEDKAGENIAIPSGPEALNQGPETFGKNILNSISGQNAIQFGHESGYGRPMRKKQASKQHIDTIMRIARKTDK